MQLAGFLLVFGMEQPPGKGAIGEAAGEFELTRGEAPLGIAKSVMDNENHAFRT